MKHLFDFSQATVFVNMTGDIIDVNDPFVRLFGYAADEVIGQSCDILFPNDFEDICHALSIGNSADNSYIRRLHKRNLKTVSKSGSEYQIELNFLFTQQGTKNIAALLLRDATEEFHTAQVKALAEEMLHEAIETIPDGFVIYDKEDRLFICNASYLETYKTSAPAIKVGETFENIIRYGLERGQYPQAGNSKEEQETWLAQRMERHLNPTQTVVQKTDSGQWLKIDERATKSGLIVGVRTDITELKLAEQKLLENQRLLEQQKTDLEKLAQQYLEEKEKAEAASKAKSEFSAIISHELRTPLTGVMGIADLLLASELSDEHRRYIEGLKSSSNNLLLLLNDILDYSKFEAEQIVFEPIVFDLDRLLDNLVLSLKPSANDKAINLSVDRSASADEANIIRSDKTKLRQILLNFTTNAIKFTHEGSVKIRVLKGPSNKKDHIKLRFEVEDSGIGIAKEHMDKLFKPFSQGDSSTTRKYGGTGLGLAISKKLVEAMDGNIGFESVAQKGSTFWFECDFEKADIDQLPEQEDTLPYLKTKGSGQKGFNLLLAEDNPVNNKVISTVLRRMGYLVETAQNGREAVDMARAGDFDLILMDMQMPELDGCDATRAIRSLETKAKDTPVIALTADVKAEQNERYRKAGINAFLSKPVDWIQLEDVIQKILV